MLSWRSLAACAAFILAARAAQAKDVDAQEREARTACLAGDYAKGVAILSKLFVSTKDPVFIYNQGRCFEQNHRYEDAVARFQEYLRVGRKLSKTEKAEAEKHVADCQDLLAKQRPSQGASDARGGRGAGKDDRERAAKKACLTGDPVSGVAILADLYIDTSDTAYLFNQGRCFEQNGRYQEAVVRFREYQRKNADAGKAPDAKAEKHIADCLALSDEQKPAPSPAAPSPEATVAPSGTQGPQSTPGPSASSSAADLGTSGSSPAFVSGSSSAGDGTLSDHASRPARRHDGKLGAFLAFERVLLPALSYGLGRGFEVGAGALLGYHQGAWMGVRYLLLEGALKPGVLLAMPLFIVDGRAVAGVQAGATLQWDVASHVGFFANLSVSYFPGTASDLGSLWALPGFGVQVWQ
jgi:hypothetical protein